MNIDRLLRLIDAISRIQRIMIFPLIALVFVTCADIFARNVLGSPLIWGFDAELQLYAALITLCWAYTEYRGSHVRIAVLAETYLSKRGQEILAVINYLVFFFPFAIVMFIEGLDYAWDSWKVREISITTPWQPIVYHIKATIPLAALMLFLQGVAQTLRHLMAALGRG